MSSPHKDWAGVMERLLEGDRLALFELTRLVTSFLMRWNAYDFRDDWDDLVQEVVFAAGLAMQEGRIRDRAAVVGYLRSTARFEFIERLKVKLRSPEDKSLPWEDVVTHAFDGASHSKLSIQPSWLPASVGKCRMRGGARQWK